MTVKMNSEEEIFLTPSEVMKLLKLKRSTFYAYIKQGVIPAVKIGRLLRIRRESVVELGKQQSVDSA